MKYRVPFVDFATLYNAELRKEILAVVDDVLQRGDFVLRSDLQRFEEDMGKYLGMKYVVGVGSGTDALNIAVRAAGIGPGDEVITVAFTCVASISAISNNGAKPVLVDVAEDYNMDAAQVERRITPHTRAILPVHLNGRACDMAKLMAIARKHKLMIIEDAAQSPGACFDGKKVGTFGELGCFSVYPMKMFGCTGDGGFIATNDEALDKKMRALRDLGQDRESGAILFHGYSSRLDNIQAAILTVKSRYFDRWIARRREAAALYHRLLSDCKPVKLPPPPEDGRYFDVYQNYVIRAQRRDKLVDYLTKKGIETLTSWYLSRPLYRHKGLGLGRVKLPNTEQFAREAISLPLNAEIRDEQIKYVAEAIHDFYRAEY
ncbi:MAG: DegT/DnrJ/EryC1/StrS family aminotransferase [Dehalococcoidales bacterium]|nr:DegT/DnrJ/EryC1/StrS family aminotransferase [Dehalococcoidales bacterium]